MFVALWSTRNGFCYSLYESSYFNNHIGKNAGEYEGVHGGRGFGRRNLEGERILEFAVTNYLVVSDSLFTKSESDLVTHQSGENQVKLITSWSSGRISN